MDWQAAWTKAYRYGRRSLLCMERAQDFAQFAALEQLEGRGADLPLLFCRFIAVMPLASRRQARAKSP